MEKSIHIEWYNGKMTIHLNQFFPASGTAIKKLMKVIEMDWAHRAEIIEQILNFLNNRNIEDEEAAKEYAKKYFEHKQQYADYRDRAAEKKHPNGCRMTKEELAEARKQRDSHKQSAATYEGNFKKMRSRVERTKKNIELIEQLGDR